MSLIGLKDSYRHSKNKYFRDWMLSIIIAGVVLALTGCGSTKSVKFKFISELEANNGHPLHILLRSVESSQFLTEDYNAVADLVHATPTDPGVIEAYTIFPGNKLKVKIKIGKEEKTPIAIYGFFSDPDQWKILLDQPLESKYKVMIEGNNMILKTGSNIPIIGRFF